MEHGQKRPGLDLRHLRSLGELSRRGEGLFQERAAEMQALRVDAVADAFATCHSTGRPACGKLLAGDVHGVDRNDLVHVAMHEQNGRRRARLVAAAPRPWRARRNSRRSPPARAARFSPTPSASMVPWLKPTSASARGPRLCRFSSASRKASSAGAAWLMPRTSSPGSRKVRLNHCRPIGAAPQGSGACGETKAACGKARAHSRPSRSGRCRRRHSRAGTRPAGAPRRRPPAAIVVRREASAKPNALPPRGPRRRNGR